MFLDLNELSDGDILEADLCIVGAGAAGITLALELENSGHEILLLESGKMDFDIDTQDLYLGENVGLPYPELDIMRLRYFGGSTNHWNGRCRAFDQIDFEARDWVRDSGWPFDRSHLEPYYVRAHEYLELGHFGYTLEEFGDDRPTLPLGDDFVHVLSQRSPPTRFAETYGGRIEQASRIRVVLSANVTAIETSSEEGPVVALEARSLEGRRLTIRARRYVLAVGGLEVPRLLLQPTAMHPEGIGNRHGMLGRYFADHPRATIGEVLLNEPHPATEMFDRLELHGATVERFLQLASETQHRERILNCRLRLSELPPEEALSPGVEALRTLREQIGRGSWPEGLFGHLAEVIRDIDTIVRYGYDRMTDADPRRFQVSFSCEPEPDPESRVTLSEEVDSLGLRRLRLNWQVPDSVLHTADTAARLLGQALGQNGLGRLRMDLDLEALRQDMGAGQYHPMGATRMHDDPRRGVVDRHSRLHGVPNLYVAGSSVFPTYGDGSPTLTIVALAVRLADHLRTQQE